MNLYVYRLYAFLDWEDGRASYSLFPPSCDAICYSGFTAWSGERDPPSVFKLLETIYSAFDELARSFGVFKVETIGDSYVAVVGE